MKTKVTIIIPVYNGENYIDRCLQSVLMQSYDNYEAIIVDDGSSDSSLLICKNYSMFDKRIFVYTQENSGVSAARNKGLKKATGDLVCFLDSDDIIEENYLKNLVESYINFIDKAQLIIHGCKIKYYKNGVVKKIRQIQPKVGLYTPNDLLNQLEIRIPLVSVQTVWGKLYRREIIKENDLWFDEKIGLTEDYLFNLCYMQKIKAVYVNECMDYHYIKTEIETSVHRYHPEYMDTICRIISKMQSMLEDLTPEFLQYVFREYCRTIYHYYSNYSRNSKFDRINILHRLGTAPLFDESLRVKGKTFMYKLLSIPLKTRNVMVENFFFELTSLIRRY